MAPAQHASLVLFCDAQKARVQECGEEGLLPARNSISGLTKPRLISLRLMGGRPLCGILLRLRLLPRRLLGREVPNGDAVVRM